MAIFGPKLWVEKKTMDGKMSIFRLFEIRAFLAKKGVFSL